MEHILVTVADIHGGQTGADCALSHDDDWRLSLGGSPWTGTH
jgi:hypothetical protein